MQYVRELGPGLPTSRLRAFLDGCAQPFAGSQLYSSLRGEKFVDESLRLSRFRSIVDAELFAIASELVDAVSAGDPLNSFSLVPNDVTHIVYDKGGFFRAHADFLSLTSNAVEEYTMLICVTPEPAAGAGVGAAPRGGETRIVLGPGREVVSKATTTPGCALLFRKDLTHEGLEVLAGSKEVVSLNVWCSRRASPQVLLVTFPAGARERGRAAGEGRGRAADEDERSRGARLMELAHAGRSYALSAASVLGFPESVFAGKLRFAASAAASAAAAAAEPGRGALSPPPRVVTFECTMCSHDDFAVVFRVLCGFYVRPADLVKHAALLDHYTIALDRCLVNAANAGNAGEAQGEGDGLAPEVPAASSASSASSASAARAVTDDIEPLPMPPLNLGLAAAQLDCSQCGKPGAKSCAACHAAAYCSGRCQKAAWAAGHKSVCKGLAAKAKAKANEPLGSPDLIICTTEERTAIVAEAAKELRLPYVRFDAVFVEGTIVYGGEMSDNEPEGVIMQPCWVSVGDYGNLLFMRGILHKGDQDKVVPHECAVTPLTEAQNHQLSEDKTPAKPLSAAQDAAVSMPGRKVAFEEYGFTIGWEDKKDLVIPIDCNSSHAYWLALKYSPLLCAGKVGVASTASIIEQLFGDVTTSEGEGFRGISGSMMVLPGGDDFGGAPSEASVSSSTSTPASASAPASFFHVDSAGNSCFSKAEAAASTQLLIDSAFLAQVQTRIKTTAFVLPQRGESHGAFFCNENVYGNMNMLRVSGLVRLDSVSAGRAASASASASALMAEQDSKAKPRAKAAALRDAMAMGGGYEDY